MIEGDETPVTRSLKQLQKQHKSLTKMETRQETLNLKCLLTNEEMLEISKEMSEHLNKMNQAANDLSAYSSQKKSEIKGHDALIQKAANLINAGAEYRDVKCNVIINESENSVTWIRLDTNEIVQVEKPIPQRYLQTELPLKEEGEF